jgi:hypothetical protein
MATKKERQSDAASRRDGARAASLPPGDPYRASLLAAQVGASGPSTLMCVMACGGTGHSNARTRVFRLSIPVWWRIIEGDGHPAISWRDDHARA